MLGGGYQIVKKLYGNPASANAMRYYMNDIPILGNLSRFYDEAAYMRDYMNNRGLSWADVKYPSKIGVRSGLVAPIQSSQSAIDRLYSDNERRAERNNRAIDREMRRDMYRNSIDANKARMAWYYSRM